MTTAPITVIGGLPTFASPEEHAAIVNSTPTSFSDIPPVLKHLQPNVSVIIEPPIPDTPASGAFVLVLWDPATAKGFQIPYPSITLHAISRGAPAPSVYLQLDAGPAPGVDPEDEDADTELVELTIVPDAEQSLDAIFEALSTCAALHPDPRSPSDDDDDEDEATIDTLNSPFDMFDGDEEEELSAVGRNVLSQAALAHMESIIYDPFERDEEGPPESDDEEEALEDADEEEDVVKEAVKGMEEKTKAA
ncbi:hypothetical protein DXG01_013972 [Tephrocybe rancida]|nr:hypothetical protein DXG01_013972 [Tephrocybe rancida]